MSEKNLNNVTARVKIKGLAMISIGEHDHLKI